MKKLFSGWRKIDFVLWGISLLAIILCFAFSPDKSVLSLITSLFGVTVVFLIAKGFAFAPMVELIYDSLYCVLSIILCYYGEVIICVFIMIPIAIFSLVSWFKNRNGFTVKINKITKKEWFLVLLFGFIVTFLIYFLLRALNTSQLIISTISFITSITGAYLVLRRSCYYAIPYILNDVILIVLWSLTILNSGFAYLPNVLSFVIFLFNDTYGLIRWKRAEKKQSENLVKYENCFIIHGSYGNNKENWFSWLEGKLAEKNYKVFNFNYPTPEGQNFESWSKILDENRKNINEKTVFVCHSISCIFLVKYCIENKIKIGKAVFVSGFNNYYFEESFDKINEHMYMETIDDFKNFANEIICIYSKNDPFVKLSFLENFAKDLKAKKVVYKSAGHFNTASGYTTFEDILKFL